MTKFEQRGVDFQYRAKNKTEAKKSLHRSCDICGKIGRNNSCKHCAIASVHNDMINIILGGR
jgi:recombinational DNA repair protein RecR